MRYGVSSLYICEALREVKAAKHIIMDPYQNSDWEGIGLVNLRETGYSDLVDFHEVLSFQYLSCLTEEGVTIDLTSSMRTTYSMMLSLIFSSSTSF